MVTLGKSVKEAHPRSQIKERKVGRGKLLTAIALMAIALSTIGYASLTLGSFTVTTKEIATVVVSPMDLGTIPTHHAGNKTFTNAIGITYGDTSFASLEVIIKVELIYSAEAFKSFNSFVVKVKDGNTVKATLTLNSPYDDFAYTITTGTETKNYNVVVHYSVGGKTVTIGAGDFQLRVKVQA